MDPVFLVFDGDECSAFLACIYLLAGDPLVFCLRPDLGFGHFFFMCSVNLHP